MRRTTFAFRPARSWTTIGALLGDVGLGFSDVVKTTIFMADMTDYADINTIYAEYFADSPPARSAVQAAALPGGFLVEIEIIAAQRATGDIE